jgi:hypothetical protein
MTGERKCFLGEWRGKLQTHCSSGRAITTRGDDNDILRTRLAATTVWTTARNLRRLPITASHCPGRKTPKSAARCRPHPCKNSTQHRSTVDERHGRLNARGGPGVGP